MASGGGPPRKSASESRSHRTWKRSNSTADGDDNSSMTSNPLDARPNNWDFSDWQPSSTFEAGKRRKKAKANPEREREKERERERERSLSQDSSPRPSEKQHRTPSTFPRTKGNPASQKLALENLRQHMTFSDLEDQQLSNDGERNNARKVTIKRERPPNYTRQDTSDSSNTRRHGSTGDASRPIDNRNNNSDQGPDTNHIVSRLMQIRDYIKQASTMMDSLQKSPDPSEAQKATKLVPVVASLKEQEHAYLDLLRRLWHSVTEAGKLGKLLTHLREQEKSYMGLLQQLLALRDEMTAAEHNPNDARHMVRLKAEPLDETASVDLDVRSEVSDATTEHTQSSSSRPRIEDKLGVDSDTEVNDIESQDQARSGTMPTRLPSWDYEAARYESEELRGREETATKSIAEGKNQLAMLKEQEDLLRKLVDQQEQLRALQGKQESLLALQKEAENKLKMAKTRRNAEELASNVDMPQVPNIPAEPLSDSENTAAGATAQADILPELQNLRHRLDYLKKNIYDVKTEVTAAEPIEVNRNPDGTISDAGRKQLQDKLQELQNKKKRMDDLVNELQGLKSMRVEQLLQNEEDVLITNSRDGEASRSPEGATGETVPSASGGQTVGEAEDLMEMMQTQVKLKKLQEVRSRLNQLRQLVGYFGADGSPDIAALMDQAEQSSLPGYSDSGDIDATAQSNLRSPTVRSRPQNTNLGTPATEQTDSQQQSDDENMPASDTTDTESRTSSLGPWGDDPEIQEKVRKLKAAKDKLRQLQNLVTTFQQNPESSGLLPEDLADLANSLDEEMEAAIPGSSAVAAAANTGGNLDTMGDNSSSAMSEGELPQQAAQRELEYEAKMQSQLKELSSLKDEREKLIAIRDQLRMLHEEFPQQGGDDGEPVRIPDRNNTEVKFAPEPQILQSSQAATYSSNDELYDRMRKQRILKEELRQKKRELEAIMRKDRPKKQYSRNQDNQSDTVSYSTEAFGTSVVSADATMATWGGSTVENLESITEDEGQSQADQEDEDDAYPIDGIVQVEEEEEENEESGETYTIENDVRQRRQARQQEPSREERRTGGRQTYPRPLADMTAMRNQKGSKGYGKTKMKNNHSRTRTRQGNYRSPEDIIEEAEGRSQLEVLQRQLETTNNLCQSLLQDHQSLYQMFRDGYSTPQAMSWNNTSPFRQGLFQDPYALPPPLQQQQQMMFKLNQCYQQMAMQQAELQSLQRQLQCLSLQMKTSPGAESQSGAATDPTNSKLSPLLQGFNLNSFQTPFFNSNQPNSFSLNPQFPPGFANHEFTNPNAYAAANGVDMTTQLGREFMDRGVNPDQGAGDSRLMDNIQVAKDSTQAAALNNSRPSPNRSATTKTKKRSNTGGNSTRDVPPASWSSVGGQKGASRGGLSGQIGDNVPKLNLDRIMTAKRERASQRPITSTQRNPSTEDKAVIGRVYSAPGRAAAAANLASKKRMGDLYRPGLSAGISGTAHADSASVSSAVSSLTGTQRTRNRDVETTDLSLFNALRESIYAEVATLISQNENRPHFLIELFRELQLLSTDYLRQTTLFSIRDLVSRYLTEENVASEPEPVPAWVSQTGATNSELTPSESLLTSDEEDFNVRIQKRLAATSALTQQILQRTGSLNNENFDYAEAAENTSSQSTPSTSYKESPFAQDSLGDTVIHLDQALRRMREYEQQKTESEHAEKVRVLTEKQSVTTKKTIEGARKRRAEDPQSDSSTSDVPHPRIDTQQLDQQIKGIMTEVIPVIKEHMDDVCSPQLLAYIKRLVVSLTRQENNREEFARFFNRQLGSILQDSLVKFEGRKLRECGEDLLIELSEVLFNELAFCRLLRDLDDPAVSAIQPRFRAAGVGPSSSAQRIVNYDSDSTDEDEEGSETTSEEAELALGAESSEPSQPANEEEDLGKSRDDELANEVLIQDADEKDEESESQLKSVIELAVSETKPFTRIGSDEDDEGSDESLSAEDPSETAVSRDAKLEQTVNGPTDGDGLPSLEGEATAEVLQSGEIGVAESVTQPGPSSSARSSEASQANGSVPLLNGDAMPEMNGEVTLDDLPVKLSVISEGELSAQIAEEARLNSDPQAITGPVESELAGDGLLLKEPDSSEC